MTNMYTLTNPKNGKSIEFNSKKFPRMLGAIKSGGCLNMNCRHCVFSLRYDNGNLGDEDDIGNARCAGGGGRNIEDNFTHLILREFNAFEDEVEL